MCKRNSRTYRRLKKRMFGLEDKKCYYCGISLNDDNISIDHKTPLARGGKNTYDNLCLCCKKCNKEKDDLTEEEYKQYLKEKSKNKFGSQEVQFNTPFLIEVEKIRIPILFRQSNIREKKVNKAKRLYKGNGYFDRPISLSTTNRLVDGYSRYVAAKDIGLHLIQAQYVHNYQHQFNVLLRKRYSDVLSYELQGICKAK